MKIPFEIGSKYTMHTSTGAIMQCVLLIQNMGGMYMLVDLVDFIIWEKWSTLDKKKLHRDLNNNFKYAGKLNNKKDGGNK